MFEIHLQVRRLKTKLNTKVSGVEMFLVLSRGGSAAFEGESARTRRNKSLTERAREASLLSPLFLGVLSVTAFCAPPPFLFQQAFTIEANCSQD